MRGALHRFAHFDSLSIRSSMRFFYTAIVLAAFAFQAVGATPTRGAKTSKAPKEPKKTVADLVAGEASMPSPIKPFATASPDEMAARFFYEALKPYGEWFEIGQFGKCWRPTGVGEQWAPYTVGSWAYSRFGWTWVSGEEFGGIVHHYGRWFRMEGTGWWWVPDLEWAASWVSWRYGTEVVGWAPLPPRAKWNSERGIGVWADREYGTGPDNYVFCPIADMSDELLSDVLVARNTNASCFQRSVPITNIAPAGKSIFCGGPSYNSMASRAKERIPVIRVAKERSLIRFREQLNDAGGTAVSFMGVLSEDRLTLMAPEWGILADRRRADALGFNVETMEEVKAVKWSEANSVELPKAAEEPVDKGIDLREVATLSGWEKVPEHLRAVLKLKIVKEVGGLDVANTPAVAFDPDRDLPTVR
jgi:hypothetical protein